jgi:hypothetical protein
MHPAPVGRRVDAEADGAPVDGHPRDGRASDGQDDFLAEMAAEDEQGATPFQTVPIRGAEMSVSHSVAKSLKREKSADRPAGVSVPRPSPGSDCTGGNYRMQKNSRKK